MDTDGIYVATAPACMRCKMVTRWLDAHHIAYQTLSLSQRPDIVAAAKNSGASSAPIVYETRNGKPRILTSGFNPAELANIISPGVSRTRKSTSLPSPPQPAATSNQSNVGASVAWRPPQAGLATGHGPQMDTGVSIN